MISKKGEVAGSKTILYIAYSFMIGFGFLAFVGTISAMSNRTSHVPAGIEIRLVLERIFSSPKCFAYQDETGRSYDIIDFDKFNTERLERCLEIGNFPYDFKFDLRIKEHDVRQEHLGGNLVEIPGIYENTYTAHTKDWYGFSFDESYNTPVLVRKDNELIPGDMTITRKRSSRLYT